eukprot:NODE_1639_length_429_cov_0.821192_g1629_i0.p1 GENE.NODE_1639_length_429_cov_0.821192_g1629_i0~~NODE_1639_length_429_cov_0.821192_g1629_i0.p1  ORF type:complete len:53 (-),score=4.25 NODE_1639_length_429_cov_0.821192_g1629_i0:159-317(-)
MELFPIVQSLVLGAARPKGKFLLLTNDCFIMFFLIHSWVNSCLMQQKIEPIF